MKKPRSMSRAELLAELTRYNPFGDYTRFSTETLRATVARYRTTHRPKP